MLKIGNVELENPFLAAPLAGITDKVMRKLNRNMGASLCFTEMVSAKGLSYQNKSSYELIEIDEDEKPVGLQIFGSDLKILGEVTKELNSCKNSILDVNMGCPVSKVVKNGEGSALLKSVSAVYDVTRVVVENSTKPVNIKIRLGWDDNSKNYLEVAKAIEAAGASSIAVHGRTREQYYSGKADWNAIAEIKKAVKINVIGNGDIFAAQDAIAMMDQTGCDMVMIARGMLGNPWIFRQCVSLWKDGIVEENVTIDEKIEVVHHHLDELVKLKGERVAVNEMRKHLGWYTKGMKSSAKFRQYVNRLENASEVKEAVERLRELV
ncbi:MAG: tRNA dihydrouridine synthase DusB [Eubacteriales bacterium]|nr:tRNA dihydrouridine synthase DusB [Eubacteriales bacterium]MDY3332551.1 tRNA dihydrouridine synthase DusB [Gallibacter sp.]